MIGWWLVLATGAGAVERAPRNPLVDAIAACLDKRVDAERLACMDSAAAALVAAERARDVVVVTREDVLRTRRSLFGLAIDQNRVVAGADAVERIERLETTIAGASNVGYDRWVLQLAEGGRWRTTEPWPYAAPRAGMAVEIHPGALGSFVLRAPGQRVVKVMRVN